jgi:broad specificity phosphatase PhoE
MATAPRGSAHAMTNVLLIRHATYDMMGKTILGRTPEIQLNDEGTREAEQLAEKLSLLPIDAIYSGPLERARQTAQPLARILNLPLQVATEFNELDMGEWTDVTLAKLDFIPEWHTWNARRSEITPPAGESMQQVQERVLEKITNLSNQFRCIAIFTHGDVIRAALTYYLGMHLDLLLRFQIDPASVSLVQMHQDCAIVRMLNWVPIGTALS